MSSVFCLPCKMIEVMKNLIRYFDMFAGIGGFRAGLNRASGFQCIGHCEIDKFADASYRAIHDIKKEEFFYPDATKIDPAELPDFDLLCAGFPCQPFSASGRKRGFADARGTLFFEISRLAEAKRPPYLLLENVPGLLFHDHCRTFAAILSALDELGYHVEWSVLNSADFGVPQSRRRVFIIGYLDARCAGKILPVFGANGKALIQVIGGHQGRRVYDPTGSACTLTSGAGGMGGKTGLYLVDLCKGRPEQSEIARCLTACYGQTCLSNRPRERSGVLVIKGKEKRIRRLTPRECFRLQGFNEEQIDRILAITSDSQAYKQAGNCVTVNVIEVIGKRIRATDKELQKEASAA